MPLVDIQRVSRSYGKVQALRDVSLTLEPGVIGLVGNNGAGKSTLLKILLGLLKPDRGQGTILDCDIIRASRQLRGKVGYMPETAAVVPLLKGVEFVALAGDLYGMPRQDARRRAHEVLNYTGLGELRYRRLDEYSAGNVQRLKLAAALVHDPQLLLLDEPTNGLDPQGRRDMLRLIEDLIRETDKSVILCTHLLGDVERLCRQVVVLHQGTVIRSGTLAELRQGASNRYELGWIGPRTPFLVRLRDAGLIAAADVSDAKITITLPADWSTGRLFALAAAAEVIVNHLKPEEEDLEGLFFRVTSQTPAAQPPGLPAAADAQEAVHGS